MIKTLNRLGIGGGYCHITKAIYNKLTANIMLNREKLKAFVPRLRTRQDVHSHYSYSIQHWKLYLEQVGKTKK